MLILMLSIFSSREINIVATSAGKFIGDGGSFCLQVVDPLRPPLNVSSSASRRSCCTIHSHLWSLYSSAQCTRRKAEPKWRSLFCILVLGNILSGMLLCASCYLLNCAASWEVPFPLRSHDDELVLYSVRVVRDLQQCKTVDDVGQ